MKKTFKSKKAEIGATMSLLVATLIIVFILVIFILFSSFLSSGVSKEAVESSLMIASKEKVIISLQAYLQTPVDVAVSGQRKTVSIPMSDLIRLAVSDDSYQKILQAKTKEILNPVFGEDYFIHANLMEIVTGPGDFIVEMPIPSENSIVVRMGAKSK